MNQYTSRPASNWSRAQIHRCVRCLKDFKSEHMAAFHQCETPAKTEPRLELIGHMDERNEPRMTVMRQDRLEYCEMGGLDLLFTMPARDFRDLRETVQTLLAHGTNHEKDVLLGRVRDLLEGAVKC
jgi:hypothetical protein